ncbi:MAG: hypothetical protein ABI592_00445 [Acidobacteriota bacterium]
MKTAPRYLAAALAAGGLFLGMRMTTFAQERRPGMLSSRGYPRMQELARELDDAAQHANDAARHSTRRDAVFVRSVGRFAARAHSFAARMDAYDTRPWQIDQEIHGLIRDASTVQARLRRTRAVDRHTGDDWNRTVDLLRRMERISQDDRRAGYGERGPNDPGSVRDDSAYHRDGGGAPPSDRPGDRAPRGGDGAFATADSISLARDVADRARRLSDRAHALAGAMPLDARQRDTAQAIGLYSNQARAMLDGLESRGGKARLDANLAQLSRLAAAADTQMKKSNVFPEIRREWTDAMQRTESLKSAFNRTAYR